MTSMAAESPSTRHRVLGRGRAFPIALLVIGAIGVVGFLWSLSIGPEHISIADRIRGTFAPDQSAPQLIVHLVRLPRALEAALVGGAFAIAGVIMQGITLNPLGAPEIMGVTAGAALMVTISVTVATSISGESVLGLSYIGAAIAAGFVFVFARLGRGGLSPMRLALAGVTVTAFLFAIMQGIFIIHVETASTLMFWLVGGVNFADWHNIHMVWPWLLGGSIVAMLMASPLNVLALGDDMAQGLGQNVGRVRFVGGVAVVVLAGAAVGIAGPVAFLGLIVPHIARALVGVNHFLVLPLSAVTGAALFVWADVGARYIGAADSQTPSGLVTALIGAPIFIYLARQQRMSS
jgi:iron complex transport system permease protein